MADRPTISDVARAAGVSVATVDRTLNGRQKVREDTVRTVLEAAQSLGYHGAGLIQQRLGRDLPVVRLGIVLQKEKQTFYQSFADELSRAVAETPGIRGSIKTVFSTSQSPAEFAELIGAVGGNVDALAATAVTHHLVTEAVAELQSNDVPCFALLNDFAQGIRQSYIGLNNVKVGRIAAAMMATAVHRPGKVAVFVGGYRWHGHELRETGFRSYFRENAPQFKTLDTLVNLETRQLTYEATLDLLARNEDLRGIYIAGGGMEGAIAALREARAPGEVALVVNEITPESSSGLHDRYVTLVISTPLRRLCREIVGMMVSATENGVSDMGRQKFLQPDLFLPESV